MRTRHRDWIEVSETVDIESRITRTKWIVSMSSVCRRSNHSKGNQQYYNTFHKKREYWMVHGILTTHEKPVTRERRRDSEDCWRRKKTIYKRNMETDQLFKLNIIKTFSHMLLSVETRIQGKNLASYALVHVHEMI